MAATATDSRGESGTGGRNLIIGNPPTVAFIDPTPSQLQEGYTVLQVLVDAQAFGTNGMITKVELYLDGALVSAKTAPNSTIYYSWHSNVNPKFLGLPDGSHELKAIAYDNNQLSTTITKWFMITGVPGRIDMAFTSPFTNRLDGTADIVLDYIIDSTGVVSLNAYTTDTTAGSNDVSVLDGWSREIGQVTNSVLFDTAFRLTGTASIKSNSVTYARDIRIDGAYAGGVLGVTGQNSSRIDGVGSSVGVQPESMVWTLNGAGVILNFESFSLANVYSNGGLRVSVPATNKLFSSLVGDGKRSIEGLGFSISNGQSIVFAAEPGITQGAGLSGFTFNILANPNVIRDPYDVWATLYGVVGGKDDDDDHDGLSNLYEFGMGGNPKDGADRGIKPVIILQSNSLYYVHARRNDDAAPNYIVETTTNLLSGVWTNTGYTVLGTNAISGNTNYNEVINSIWMDPEKVYFRLRVTAP